MSIKIIIIGGVAGGASAAAKARRTNEDAEILLFERGPYVSFANCGLPYYIGGNIPDRDSLLLRTPKGFWERFRIQVKVLHEVTRIDPKSKKIEVRNLESGQVFEESYDKLILSPGAGALVPDLPGIRSSNVFIVKTVPDSDAVKKFITEKKPRKAVVVGAGFIGLESAEALSRFGMDVTVVEKAEEVLPVFDADVARLVSEHLRNSGIKLVLADGIKAFHGKGAASELELESGKKISMDMAILSIGVRPELDLAKKAGLKIGESGGIFVDEKMQTSDPDIYAAGDAVELTHLVTGKKVRMPLAGPANKQGRAAGANAAGGDLSFKGSLGTAIVETMGLTAAKTGLSEKEAKAAGLDSFSTFTHSLDHAGYYPGAQMMHIKLVAEAGSGKLLGAQIVGENGVDKRIDVLATALSAGFSVKDLENLDLAYAPQFSSAKDPVIMAGFVASNVLRAEVRSITCDELQSKMLKQKGLQVVDVRTKREYDLGHIDGAKLIPLDELRERLQELDPSAETVIYCQAGLRGYLAVRILMQNGFKDVLNVTGGFLSCPPEKKEDGEPESFGGTVSVQGLKKAMDEKRGVVIDVREPDEFAYERIEGSKNIPVGRLIQEVGSIPGDRNLYVVCQSGLRTLEAVQALKKAGFLRIFAVDGGVTDWKKAGYPVKGAGGPLPIMRQVQIIAGALALVGGLFISIRWVAVIVGAGLMFAGISGLCGMAALLQKMPWNKVKEPVKTGSGGSGCGCPK